MQKPAEASAQAKQSHVSCFEAYGSSAVTELSRKKDFQNCLAFEALREVPKVTALLRNTDRQADVMDTALSADLPVDIAIGKDGLRRLFIPPAERKAHPATRLSYRPLRLFYRRRKCATTYLFPNVLTEGSCHVRVGSLWTLIRRYNEHVCLSCTASVGGTFAWSGDGI